MIIEEKIKRPASEDHLEQLHQVCNKFQLLKREIAEHVVGNHKTVNLILNAMLSNGHILLEGVPGVAKTTMVKTVAKLLGLDFKRIQFTPDLLPADLIGTLIYNSKTQDFQTKKGPIFSNIVLADEINRAPAKVQSALLECMQEHQVTIGSETHKLQEPFFVFSTQNPIEQEGTYQLPEAQLDRFIFKIKVDYPSIEEEAMILNLGNKVFVEKNILSKEDIIEAQKVTELIYVDQKIIQYIVEIVWATRDLNRLKKIKKEAADWISFGASPRASIALFQASKAEALLNKRHFVTPDDVKTVALPILRHRIVPSYQAQADEISTDVIAQLILDSLPTP